MNDCAFCDRTKFEERIIAEDSLFYTIATLGQITDGGYVLLFPKSHVRCIGDMAHQNIGILGALKHRVCEALTQEYKSGIFMFEHGIVGQTVEHAHLHITPAQYDPITRIKNDFPDSRIEHLISLEELKTRYSFHKKPYLLWKSIDMNWCACWDPPAPAQYLRTILAEELGCGDRANWRTMDPEFDKSLWSSTVSRLKPHLAP